MPPEQSAPLAGLDPSELPSPAPSGSNPESARDAVIRAAFAWQAAHRSSRRSVESASTRVLLEQEREDADWFLNQAIDALRAAGNPPVRLIDRPPR